MKHLEYLGISGTRVSLKSFEELQAQLPILSMAHLLPGDAFPPLQRRSGRGLGPARRTRGLVRVPALAPPVPE
jgi:hypothetical protein